MEQQERFGGGVWNIEFEVWKIQFINVTYKAPYSQVLIH